MQSLMSVVVIGEKSRVLEPGFCFFYIEKYKTIQITNIVKSPYK